MRTTTNNSSGIPYALQKMSKFKLPNIKKLRYSSNFDYSFIYCLAKKQGSVERGFRFLKDPLFLAFSVFVKKPERIVVLGLIMVLRLLVYRLAEHRLRTGLAETEQTLPDPLNRPKPRPTLRSVLQCFAGFALSHI